MRTPADDAIAKTGTDGFGWDGGTGTTWRSDSKRGVTGILLTQRGMSSPAPPQIFTDFYGGMYRALDG
jgi:CubicO group peptidase (beta-lactamase class C family)